mgnify:CR=1 FL=1
MLMAKLSKDQNQGRYFKFLIDSGADYTLIPKSKAILLGLNYKKLKDTETKVESANHSYIKTKKTKLTITIEIIQTIFVNPLLARGNRALFCVAFALI